MRLFLVMVVAASAHFGCGHVHAAILRQVVTDSKLPYPLSSHSAVYDGDDSIYVTGGVPDSPFVADQVVKYSLSSGNVERVGTFLNISRGVAVMDSEDIIYFGGQDHQFVGSSGVYRFSTRTGVPVQVARYPTSMTEMGVAWDPAARAVYTFGGQTPDFLYTDYIYRFVAANNQLDLIGRLFFATNSLTSAWVAGRGNGGEVLFFGGWLPSGVTDRNANIFYPNTNSTATFGSPFPDYFRFPASAFAERHEKIYIVDRAFNTLKLIEFGVHTGSKGTVDVDDWQPLESSACVYVDQLDRLYILGGYGHFPGEDGPRNTDQISYIDFGEGGDGPTTVAWEPTPPVPTRPPPGDCSDGQTKLISDPFCCENFYLCNGGVATKVPCPEGQHFNPRHSQCQDYFLVGCGITFSEPSD